MSPPYYNIAGPIKSLRIIGSFSKFPPADNLPVKIRPSQAAAGRIGFLPVNCRPGRLLCGRSYKGTPALMIGCHSRMTAHDMPRHCVPQFRALAAATDRARPSRWLHYIAVPGSIGSQPQARAIPAMFCAAGKWRWLSSGSILTLIAILCIKSIFLTCTTTTFIFLLFSFESKLLNSKKYQLMLFCKWDKCTSVLASKCTNNRSPVGLSSVHSNRSAFYLAISKPRSWIVAGLKLGRTGKRGKKEGEGEKQKDKEKKVKMRFLNMGAYMQPHDAVQLAAATASGPSVRQSIPGLGVATTRRINEAMHAMLLTDWWLWLRAPPSINITSLTTSTSTLTDSSGFFRTCSLLLPTSLLYAKTE